MTTYSNTLQSWPLSAAMKLRRAFRPLVFHLWHPWFVHANRKPGRTRFGELELLTDPHVFNPAQHFSSRILAEHVKTLPLKDCCVLDMGTGSGIIGMTAARQGAEVIALDINPYAAALAQKNAWANGLRGRFKVTCGDLLEALAPAARFDWIIFNPPFFAAASGDLLQTAYNAGAQLQTIARFLQQASGFLAPGGKVVMILSSDMKIPECQSLFQQHHYQISQIKTKPHFFEIFYLVHLRCEKLSTDFSDDRYSNCP